MKLEKLEQIIRTGILVLAGSMMFSLFIAQAVTILLILLWLIKLVVFKKADLRNNPFTYPFIAFVIARIISVFLSTDISQSVQTLNKEIFFYPLFFIVVDCFPIEDKKYFKWFVVVLVSSALVASIYGSVSVLIGATHRAASTTSGFYTLGTFLTVVLAFLLVIGSDRYFIPSKLVWLLALIIVVVGILFTFNRIHWALIVLLFFVFGVFRERKFVLIVSILAAIIVIAVPMFRERLLDLLFFSRNLSDRDVLLQGASMIYSKHPLFGFGPLTFREIFPLFEKLMDQNVSSWHNDYLQVYIESGAVGLVAFLWLGFSIFYCGIEIFLSKYVDTYSKDIAFALLLAMVVLYATGIVGTFIFSPISSLLFQLLLGILALTYRKLKLKNQLDSQNLSELGME
ncbi:MAG TPA: O-antigen ligase family protein [Ignavibacteriaceae bacterium]